MIHDLKNYRRDPPSVPGEFVFFVCMAVLVLLILLEKWGYL